MFWKGLFGCCCKHYILRSHSSGYHLNSVSCYNCYVFTVCLSWNSAWVQRQVNFDWKLKLSIQSTCEQLCCWFIPPNVIASNNISKCVSSGSQTGTHLVGRSHPPLPVLETHLRPGSDGPNYNLCIYQALLGGTFNESYSFKGSWRLRRSLLRLLWSSTQAQL